MNAASRVGGAPRFGDARSSTGSFDARPEGVIRRAHPESCRSWQRRSTTVALLLQRELVRTGQFSPDIRVLLSQHPNHDPRFRSYPEALDLRAKKLNDRPRAPPVARTNRRFESPRGAARSGPGGGRGTASGPRGRWAEVARSPPPDPGTRASVSPRWVRGPRGPRCLGSGPLQHANADPDPSPSNSETFDRNSSARRPTGDPAPIPCPAPFLHLPERGGRVTRTGDTALARALCRVPGRAVEER